MALAASSAFACWSVWMCGRWFWPHSLIALERVDFLSPGRPILYVSTLLSCILLLMRHWLGMRLGWSKGIRWRWTLGAPLLGGGLGGWLLSLAETRFDGELEGVRLLVIPAILGSAYSIAWTRRLSLDATANLAHLVASIGAFVALFFASDLAYSTWSQQSVWAFGPDYDAWVFLVSFPLGGLFGLLEARLVAPSSVRWKLSDWGRILHHPFAILFCIPIVLCLGLALADRPDPTWFDPPVAVIRWWELGMSFLVLIVIGFWVVEEGPTSSKGQTQSRSMERIGIFGASFCLVVSLLAGLSALSVLTLSRPIGLADQVSIVLVAQSGMALAWIGAARPVQKWLQVAGVLLLGATLIEVLLRTPVGLRALAGSDGSGSDSLGYTTALVGKISQAVAFLLAGIGVLRAARSGRFPRGRLLGIPLIGAALGNLTILLGWAFLPESVTHTESWSLSMTALLAFSEGLLAWACWSWIGVWSRSSMAHDSDNLPESSAAAT